MSYVQRVLQPGEVIRHTASAHWIVYWPGALCFVLALAALIWAGFLPTAWGAGSTGLRPCSPSWASCS